MRNKISTAYTALTALIIWFGLVLQFYISTEKYIIEGRTFTGAVIQILSYYTIQTNLLIAIALTVFLWKPGSPWGRFFSRTTVLTAIAVYITIVGLIYAFVLKGQWQPKGLFKLADNLLHTVSPVMFVLLWLIFVRKETIKWNQLFYWAIFPFLYLIYSLIRGAITGDYPYNFINAALIGYQQTAINAVLVLLLFLFISTCFIAVSRLLRKS